jgi:hypothetical protein
LVLVSGIWYIWYHWYVVCGLLQCDVCIASVSGRRNQTKQKGHKAKRGSNRAHEARRLAGGTAGCCRGGCGCGWQDARRGTGERGGYAHYAHLAHYYRPLRPLCAHCAHYVPVMPIMAHYGPLCPLRGISRIIGSPFFFRCVLCVLHPEGGRSGMEIELMWCGHSGCLSSHKESLRTYLWSQRCSSLA